MKQKTEIINAEELFGDFSKMSEFRNMEDGSEKNWEWPDKIGNGFMYVIKIRPGLMLGIGNYQLWEHLTVSFEWKSSSFIMGFGLSGSFSSTLRYGHGKEDFFMFNSGQSLIGYMPGWQGIAKYPVRTPLRTVGIYIDPLLLNTFIDGQQEQLPTIMNDIINGDNEKYYKHSLTTTPLG